jgi:Cu/Ag efflux protein CusF
MESLSFACVRSLITRSHATGSTQRGGTALLASLMSPAQRVRDRATERRYPSRWRVSFVFGLVAVTGCAAAYTPPPLTRQHPAHPEATAAPELPPSNTLAYSAADAPSRRPAVPTGQRGTQDTPPSVQKNPQTVVGEGKVIAVVPGNSEIVVTHGAIQGFMEAMTMGYQIEPASLLEKVQAGDTVRFTIDTQRKAIVKIEKLAQ